MSKAGASQQRDAANARWRGRVVSRSSPLVRERIGELPDDEVIRLAHAANEEAERRRLVARVEGR